MLGLRIRRRKIVALDQAVGAIIVGKVRSVLATDPFPIREPELSLVIVSMFQTCLIPSPSTSLKVQKTPPSYLLTPARKVPAQKPPETTLGILVAI